MDSCEENSFIDLVARGRKPDYECLFIDSIALPNEILEKTIVGKNRKSFKRAPKIRIDFRREQDISIEELTILSIVEKIVNRGALTRLSKESEDLLIEKFNQKLNTSKQKGIIDSLKSTLSKDFETQFFDGEPRIDLKGESAESFFYKNILIPNINPSHIGAVIPQAYISSFVSNPEDFKDQRVDFLIHHNNINLIIEIDDPTHDSKIQSDNKRDDSLSKAGFRTFRIKTDSLKNTNNTDIAKLLDILSNIKNSSTVSTSKPANKLIAAIQLFHWIQLILICLRKNGGIGEKSQIFLDPKISPLFNEDEFNFISKNALSELKNLSKSISSLYEMPPIFEGLSIAQSIDLADKIISTKSHKEAPEGKNILVQELLIDLSLRQLKNQKIANLVPASKEADIKFILNFIYRFKDFRPNQLEGISNALHGNDSIVLLPTGSGKSVIYQLCSFILPGMSIIIDPIISLIEDQSQNLEFIGIDRCLGLSSNTKDVKKSLKNLAEGNFMQLYISPERMQMNEFREILKTFSLSKPIPLFVLDEAHCISEWGHDFRVAYLNIAETGRNVCTHEGKAPTVLALTATASDFVLKDIQREISITEENTISPDSFERRELVLDVVKCGSSEKPKYLNTILSQEIPREFGQSYSEFYKLNGEKTNSGIIFAPFVNGDFGVKNILFQLKKMGFKNSELYSGEQPKLTSLNYKKSWGEEKNHIATMFKNNIFQILSATKAFGMGIDKPNIRFTIHYNLPPSIESYIQEAGRGGRDREKTINYILASLENGDGYRNKNDVQRNNFFFDNAFKGVDKEIEDLQKVLDKLSLVNNSKEIYYFKNLKDKSIEEKSIHRLKSIGVIKDYTIDYSNKSVELHIAKISKSSIAESYKKYLSRYNEDMAEAHRKQILDIKIDQKRQFILEVTRKLLNEYIYAHIAKSRKIAQENIWRIIEKATSIPDKFARRRFLQEETLRYFSNSFIDILDELRSKNSNVDGLVSKIQSSASTKRDRKNLLAQINRALESDPSNPSLLLSSAVLTIYSEENFVRDIPYKINNAVNFITEYSQDNIEAVHREVLKILNIAFKKNEETGVRILNEILESIDKDLLFDNANNIINNDTLFKTIKLLSINHKISRLAEKE